MSAGTGVVHSEFNASKTDTVHFLQIWLIPSQRGIKPGYEQKTFSDAAKRGTLKLVASPEASDGSLTIHTDANVYAGLFDKGESAKVELAPGRHAWVHVARGKVKVNGNELGEGDGAAVSDERAIQVEGVANGEVLVFDLA
jgi:redox-sensitive bicupin YhaK (pirin superfamily)